MFLWKSFVPRNSWHNLSAAKNTTKELLEQVFCHEIPACTTNTVMPGIWLRDSTSKMFNIARIPMPHCDILSSPPPPSSQALKLLLMIHNWCYSISVYHPPHSPSQTPKLMNPREIGSRIQ